PLFEDELGAHQVQVALRVDEDAHAVALEHLVALTGVLGPLHVVRQPRAAAALHRDAQPCVRSLPIREQLLQARHGAVGETDTLAHGLSSRDRRSRRHYFTRAARFFLKSSMAALIASSASTEQ